jgi:hypothetical protein
MNMKIKSARITAYPKSFFDPMPQVFITLENNKEEFLFEFYPDEINFSQEEFIGLTVEEAKSLKFKKDKAYLQS